jgi:hypothetical protein
LFCLPAPISSGAAGAAGAAHLVARPIRDHLPPYIHRRRRHGRGRSCYGRLAQGSARATSGHSRRTLDADAEAILALSFLLLEGALPEAADVPARMIARR